MDVDKNTESLLLRLMKIFVTFFKIGLFTFGGGFAMIPLMEREIVDNHGWIEKDKFIDAISITQSVPGAVAVNLSIFFGYNLAGFIGALVASIGVVIPSFIIILIIAAGFNKFSENPILNNIFKGIRPAVVGLVLYAGTKLAKNINWSWKLAITFILVFIGNSFFSVSPITIVITVIIIGSILSINKYKHISKKSEEYHENC